MPRPADPRSLRGVRWLRGLVATVSVVAVLVCGGAVTAGAQASSAPMDMDMSTAGSTTDPVVSPVGCDRSCVDHATAACAAPALVAAPMLAAHPTTVRAMTVARRQALTRVSRSAGSDPPPWASIAPVEQGLLRV